MSGPVITIISPSPSSINNSNTSRIIAKVVDQGTGINIPTIDVIINGVHGAKNGIIQTSFNGTIEFTTLSEITIDIQRDLPFQDLESVNVAIAARDGYNQPAATTVYSFITEDPIAADFLDFIPSDQQTQVLQKQKVSFRIRRSPRETSLKLETLKIAFTGIIQDEYGNPLLDGYGNPVETIFVQPDVPYDQRQVVITEEWDKLGYAIEIQPFEPLPSSSEITLKVEIEDSAGNSSSESITFVTVDDKLPYIANQDPLPNSISNSIGTAVNFTIGDKDENYIGSGINKDSLTVTIDNNLAIDQGIVQSGFVGQILENTSLGGFDISLVSNQLFTPRKTINVEIEVSDFSNNELLERYSFTTEDILAPICQFTFPGDFAVDVDIDSFLVITFISEVAVGELDLSSIYIELDGIPVYLNNNFQTGLSGFLTQSGQRQFAVSFQSNNKFALNSSHVIFAQIQDVFGNQTQENFQFQVTSVVSLTSTISPEPQIYDSLGESIFPSVGSILYVTLTSNKSSAEIYYTIDGTNPIIGNSNTFLYSQPFSISTNKRQIVKYFAKLGSEVEDINVAEYIFSHCPEIDIWEGNQLERGREYTRSVKLNKSKLDSNSLISIDTLGKASYIQDLGRASFVDQLNFDTFGFANFRVRINDDLNSLKTTKWCNQTNTLENLEITGDGYDSTVTISQNNIKITQRKTLTSSFDEKVVATLNESLNGGIVISSDMKVQIDKASNIGAFQSIQIEDQLNTVEVQQYLSRANQNDENLLNQNSLIGESVDVTPFLDGYVKLTDGERGYTTFIGEETSKAEIIDFAREELLNIVDGYQLGDFLRVNKVSSLSPSVYNTFDYEGTTPYSSAEFGRIDYNRFEQEKSVVFAISVINKPLDNVLSTIKSYNLNPETDQYEYSEYNGIFKTIKRLEQGDYLFRFKITDLNENIRYCGNGSGFFTLQDLSSVIEGDKFLVEGKSYLLHGARKIDNTYFLEFYENYPEPKEILSWKIVNSNDEDKIASSLKIFAVDQLDLGYGRIDATGLLANLIVEEEFEQVEFVYYGTNVKSVELFGSFDNYQGGIFLNQQFDSTELSKGFDLDLNTEYNNSHLNFNKITIEPILPIVIDRIKFYSGVECSEKQRARLELDDEVVTRSEYLGHNSTGTCQYVSESREEIDLLENLLETSYKTESDLIKRKQLRPLSLPEIIETDIVEQEIVNLSETDLYTCIDDEFCEWRFMESSQIKNTIPRSKIGIITRFDSYSGNPRKHKEFEIYTLPEIPTLVGDYQISSTGLITRTNRSGYAASSNNVKIHYSLQKNLSEVPLVLYSLKDKGLSENFHRANIISAETNQIVYVDYPNFLIQDQKVIVSNGIDHIWTEIEAIDLDSGKITFREPALDNGWICSDYQITEDEERIYVRASIPEFKVSFQEAILLSEPLYQPIITTSSSEFYFRNKFEVLASSLLGGRFKYPLLVGEARIVEARNQSVVLQSGEAIELLYIKIDKELLYIDTQLGVIIETFNTLKDVIDYQISKSDGEVQFLNQSGLGIGFGVEVSYGFSPTPYQVPNEMWKIETSPLTEIRFEINTSLHKVTFKEIEKLTINFFNGFASLAPTSVEFTINDQIVISKSYNQSIVTDGYNGDYNPLNKATGSIRQFFVATSELPVDWADKVLNTIKVKFLGRDVYHIGEIEAICSTEIVDTVCRVLINQQEVFKSPEQILKFHNYKIIIQEGLVLIFLDQNEIYRGPLVFANPVVKFLTSGKVYDDRFIAEFRNINIDRYFIESPGKIKKEGRFIEIEGMMVN